MTKAPQDVLEILKAELEFIDKGGYGVVDKQEMGAALTMFADSLTCLNYGYPYRVRTCVGCPLMEFVPEHKRASLMPCHHIPLDSSGQTVEEIEEKGSRTLMQEAVKTWLRQTISRIELQRPA